jgi:hypothetical protein
MMIARVALVLLVLAGCESLAAFGEPVSAERIEQSAQAWQAHGFAFPEACAAEARDGRVRVAYAESAEEMAAYCTRGDAAGCSVHTVQRGADGPEWITSIGVNATLAEREQARALEHELRHWLLRCSTGDSDHAHTHDGAWYDFEGRSVLGAGDREGA